MTGGTAASDADDVAVIVPVVAQCKCEARKVGVGQVRELEAVAQAAASGEDTSVTMGNFTAHTTPHSAAHQRAQTGWLAMLVSSAGFTRYALSHFAVSPLPMALAHVHVGYSAPKRPAADSAAGDAASEFRDDGFLVDGDAASTDGFAADAADHGSWGALEPLPNSRNRVGTSAAGGGVPESERDDLDLSGTLVSLVLNRSALKMIPGTVDVRRPLPGALDEALPAPLVLFNGAPVAPVEPFGAAV